MHRTCLSLDKRTLTVARALSLHYGNASSVSSVVRRAIALLEARWTKLDSMPRARAQELADFGVYLGTSQRGQAAGRAVRVRGRRSG